MEREFQFGSSEHSIEILSNTLETHEKLIRVHNTGFHKLI